jgi:GTP1/Obg family GTP-binding protein
LYIDLIQIIVNIKQIINEAFENAQKKAFEEEKKHPEISKQKIHAFRSQSWVESLAEAFRKEYKDDKNISVFSKYHTRNRTDFGLNELLYDISVCKINYTESPKHKIKLAYIEKALWLVESEMAKDTRQLVYDFNKLVIGDSKNKLFVGPLSNYNDEILGIFKKIAKNCNGDIWVGFISHPGKWESSNAIKLKIFNL